MDFELICVYRPLKI